MAKGKVTIYFWYRDSAFGYVSRATHYSYSAMKYLAYTGLFRLFRGNCISNEAVIEARQKFTEIPKLGTPLVGHASLQTHRGGPNDSGIYASFWPKEHHLTPVDKVGIAGGLVNSLERDKELEFVESGVKSHDNKKSIRKKDPDYIVELNDLDIDAINEAFLVFKENINNINWSLWGSASFRNEQSRNCAGLVEYLLDKGGIYSSFTRRNKPMDLYRRVTWRYSELASPGINGIVWGAMLNGTKGAAIYGIASFMYAFSIISVLTEMKVLFRFSAKTSQDISKASIKSSLQQSLNSPWVENLSGTLPCMFWSVIKGAKIGYSIGVEYGNGHLIKGIIIGAGVYLLATFGLIGISAICMLPIVYAIGAITECICEGTGVVLTPGGLMQLVEYAKDAELHSHYEKDKIAESFDEVFSILKIAVRALLVFAGAVYMVSGQIDNTITLPYSFRKP